jgi:hypothetical protein
MWRPQTGAYLFTAELDGKRLGLLHDVVPKARIIAVLINANYPNADAQLRDVQSATDRLGVRLVVLSANSDHDFEAAFASLIEQKAEALLVCASPLFNNTRDQLVAQDAIKAWIEAVPFYVPHIALTSDGRIPHQRFERERYRLQIICVREGGALHIKKTQRT